jgi:hypothetical protein
VNRKLPRGGIKERKAGQSQSDKKDITNNSECITSKILFFYNAGILTVVPMHAEHAVQTLSYILALGFLRQVFTCSSG